MIISRVIESIEKLLGVKFTNEELVDLRIFLEDIQERLRRRTCDHDEHDTICTTLLDAVGKEYYCFDCENFFIIEFQKVKPK